MNFILSKIPLRRHTAGESYREAVHKIRPYLGSQIAANVAVNLPRRIPYRPFLYVFTYLPCWMSTQPWYRTEVPRALGNFAFSPLLHLHHRHLLHGLLSPRMATLDITANIGCSECFRFRYVTNVNHCIVPKALIVPRSKSIRSRPDNGKNVRRKHSLQPIAAPLCAVRYCVNYNVSSPFSTCLWSVAVATANQSTMVIRRDLPRKRRPIKSVLSTVAKIKLTYRIMETIAEMCAPVEM